MHPSEVINLIHEYSTCSDLEDYPFIIRDAVGASLGSNPVICGGQTEDPQTDTNEHQAICYRIVKSIEF